MKIVPFFHMCFTFAIKVSPEVHQCIKLSILVSSSVATLKKIENPRRATDKTPGQISMQLAYIQLGKNPTFPGENPTFRKKVAFLRQNF